MPTSLSTPVVAAGAQVRAEAALRPAPEVVGEPERAIAARRPASRLHRERRPADERQAQAAVVDGERPAASSASTSWRPRWAKPAASRPVARCSSGSSTLLDAQPGADGVDRHPHLAAEARREREAGRARRRRERRWPESGSRASKPVSSADERAAGALGDPEAAALPLGERGDGEVGAASSERAQVAAQVGVAEQQRARRRGALGERQRLALAAPRRAGATRAPAASRALGRRVARAVVGDDDLAPRGTPPRSAATVCADPLLLVARGDEDGQRLSHPLARPGRQRRQRAVGRPSPSARSGRAAAPASSSASASRPAGVSTSSTVERPALAEDGDRRVGSRRSARRPTAGTPAAPSPLVEAEQEAAPVAAALRRRGAHDDDAVGRRRDAAGLLLDERRRERVPERRLAARARARGRARGRGSRGSPCRARPAASQAAPFERRVAAAWRSTGTFSARTRTGCAARVRQRAARPTSGCRRPTEPTKTTATCLPLSRSCIERRVRLVDEASAQPSRSRGAVGRLGRLLVEPVLESSSRSRSSSSRSALVDETSVGDADADEDPDDERDEDGRERGDVVAEVEHAVRCRPQSGTEVVQAGERRLGGRTGAGSTSSGPLDRQRRRPCALGARVVEPELDVEALGGHVPRDAQLERLDLEDEQRRRSWPAGARATGASAA